MLREFFEKYQIGDAAVAAGVSGGADSLALLFQLDAFLRPQGRRVIALTVDHGLRPESRDEAEYVAKLAAERQIEHHILTWEGKKPEKGIEEAARTARYGLLCGWCRDNGVGTLAVAHHLLDQAETFFMRLQRGSGLNGLCGMAPLSEKNGVRLIRPFLQVHPERLKEFLRERGVSWAEDPFNRCDDYLRVRVRKFLPQLAATLDITPERIADTMSVLARSRDCLEEQAAQFVDRYVRRYEKAGFSVSRLQLAGLHAEVCFRVLCFLLKETAGAIIFRGPMMLTGCSAGCLMRIFAVRRWPAAKSFRFGTGCGLFPNLRDKSGFPKRTGGLCRIASAVRQACAPLQAETQPL